MHRDVKLAITGEAIFSLALCGLAMTAGDDILWCFAMIPWAVVATMYAIFGDKD